MRITTKCPNCGVVEVDGEDIKQYLDPERKVAWYTFECYKCANLIYKPANQQVVRALREGVHIELQQVPQEMLDSRRSDTHSTPMGVDDLLDMRLLIGLPDVEYQQRMEREFPISTAASSEAARQDESDS